MERKDNISIYINEVKKMYKLGTIGGGTLQGDLQSWWCRVRGKEDPNTKIGENQRSSGTTFMALNGVDLSVYQGEALGIIGGNGAGKSTLLKLLSRVTAPTEGTIDINGRIVSMLEVGTGFSPEMTGRENIYMNGAILGMTKSEIDKVMEDIIEFSEIREFIDTPVKRYSSGIYVKLAFSVAAHLDSEIMIMDEVLAVGDMAFQKKCLEKMRQASVVEGRTVLYVSHNMNTIRQLCDRCVVLDAGKVIFEGGVEESIEIYLGTTKEIEENYVYSEEHHSNKSALRSITIQSLNIIGEKRRVYYSGDIATVLLKCKAMKQCESTRIRFEISAQDGALVGTMLSNEGISFELGEEKTIEIEIDTKFLTVGKYKIDIVAYTCDQLGNEDFLDGVYPGFYIEIEEKIDGFNHVKWSPKYWGHIHLPDITIAKIREEY